MTTYTITDGDLSVSFMADTGYKLLQDGWSGNSTAFKGGGTYGNSAVASGRVLRHAVYDNVVENYRTRLTFTSTDDMINSIDDLEELLLNRAPRYWLDRFYNDPVYITRQLDGESNAGYALISQGNVVKPANYFDERVVVNQTLLPVMIQVNRQPFWLGAIPGTAQKSSTISARQSWSFAEAWAVTTTGPAGYIFCFAELDNGDIYAGGASEIFYWNGSTWAAATVTPVTLAADVTSCVLLDNGDILFGESGRIIKRTAAGVWSVEDSTPTGQVYALIEATSGAVYAADNGQIVKRDVAGAWSVDDVLPTGQVYSLLQSTNGRLWAGGTGEILRTADASTPTDLEIQISAGTDDAEQSGSSMALTQSDLDFFQSRYIGLRFQSVTIPNGATINSAVVELVAEENESGTSGTMNIFCEDVDDSSTFTSASNNISGRTMTTAYTAWTNEATWSGGNTYDTADFTTAVQEVVNRSGWATGQDMSVIFVPVTSTNDRDAESYEGNASKAPTLKINYSAPLVADSTWEQNSTFPTGNVRALAQVSGVIFGGDNGQIISSDDDGATWSVTDTTPTNETRALRYSGGVFYAGDNGNILVSTDNGINWKVDDTLPAGYVEDFLFAASDSVYAADNGQILTLEPTTFSPGQEASATSPVFIANHHTEAQLTHIYNDDGGVFTSIYPISSFPQTLFPGTSAADDNVYFGINTALSDTGPFSSLVFDLLTGASAATSYAITWEYWNGAWVTLTTQDGTSQLSLVGVNSVSWEVPADWATTAVNSITGYWIRARLSALTGAFTNPVQQTRDIYSAVTPFIELAATQALGTINSLARIRLQNRSDNGGPGGSAPLLYSNRIMAGVMPVTNHTNFRAYLNFADEQNQTGVSIDVSVDTDATTSVVTNLSAPTGRAVFFDAGGASLNALTDRASIDLATTIARDYYGTFRAFLRGKQTGGSAGEVSLRLKVVSGTGGISSLSDIQTTASTTDHELIEFEELVILPVSSLFTSDELGDQTSIVLQVAASAADADFYAYDLFLLPTNLMYIDAKDEANTTTSAISNGIRLSLDSVTLPKLLVKAVAEKVSTGVYKASYRVDSNGPAELLINAQQRLWILTASTSSAGSNVWLSKPAVLHSGRVSATDRWITGRGVN